MTCIVNFQKKYMRQAIKKVLGGETSFICGDIKYNTLEITNKKILIPQKRLIKEYGIKNKSLLEFHKKKLLTIKNKTQEESKKTDEQINTEDKTAHKIKNIQNCVAKYETLYKKTHELGNEYDHIGFTKQKHGFSGWVINDKIYYVFHTSHGTSKIWGVKTENIAINESLNPIQFVNSVQMMEVEDFKKYFKFTKPDHMLESSRYGGCKKEDLAYCSLRVICKSINYSQQILQIEEMNEKDVEVFLKDIFVIDEEDVIQLPAQVIINEEVGKLEGVEFSQKAMEILEEKKDDFGFKKGLITEALDTYNALTKW